MDTSTENIIKYANFMANSSMTIDGVTVKVKDMLLALVTQRDEAEEVALLFAGKARRLQYSV
jgi:hypothetical protein